jgi:hypothetical protein
MTPLIAQTFSNPTTGGEPQALQIITDSVNLARATALAWDSVWINLFQPLDSGLWIGLVKLGLTLAACSILFLVLTSGKEIIDRQSWSELAAIFVWPIVIAIFLGGNGNLLSQTIIVSRNLAAGQVQSVLNAQLGELTFKNAISQVGISNIAKQQLENLYSECRGKIGEELVQCWQSKQESAQQMVEQAKSRQKAHSRVWKNLHKLYLTLLESELPQRLTN